MRWFSLDEITRVPLRLRICSFVRLIMPWRLRVWPCLTLPFAVNLKRFLAPDFVFSLGISRLLLAKNGRLSSRSEPPRHALLASDGSSKRGGVILERQRFARLWALICKAVA